MISLSLALRRFHLEGGVETSFSIGGLICLCRAAPQENAPTLRDLFPLRTPRMPCETNPLHQKLSCNFMHFIEFDCFKNASQEGPRLEAFRLVALQCRES